MRLSVSKIQIWFAEWLTWSTLSVFGNSPIVRLVALAPIVAAAIKVQAAFFEETLYLKEAEWLYWSLISIALGQVLYFVFCPPIIKKYGTDIARHTIESLSSMPQLKIAELLANRLRSFYLSGQLELGADPQDPDIRKHLLDALERRDVSLSGPAVDRLMEAFADYYTVVDGAEIHRIGGLRFDVLDELAQRAPEFLTGPSPDRATYLELRHVISERAHNPEQDWKVGALHWRYTVANAQGRPLVLVIAALYALGSMYFLYRTLDGLRFMVGHLIGVDQP